MIQLAVPPVLSLFLGLGSDFCFALASLQVKLKVPAQLDSAADSQVLFTAIPVFMVNFVALLSLSMNVLPFTSALMLACKQGPDICMVFVFRKSGDKLQSKHQIFEGSLSAILKPILASDLASMHVILQH